MRIGVCTSPDAIAEPVDGLDFVEGTVGDLLCPREPDEAFERRLAAIEACPVPVEAVNCFIPGDLKTTGPEVNIPAVDEYVATALARAQRAGIATIVFGSGGSRGVPDGWNMDEARGQLVEHLKRWGTGAAEAGVVIALEPLHAAECNIVTTVGEGADVVRRVGHPNVRLLADTYHMLRQGDPPEAVADAGGLIVHVHCAEGEGRGPLGTVGEDQRPFFRALIGAGYDGRISIEARWEDFAAQLPNAVKALREQIETA